MDLSVNEEGTSDVCSDAGQSQKNYVYSEDNHQSEEDKALKAMQEKLTKYVVDSFVAAGFDTLEVISEIDTKSSNDLDEIEQFVTTECEQDDRLQQGFSVSGSFKFLPGHRRRILNFINGII